MKIAVTCYVEKIYTEKGADWVKPGKYPVLKNNFLYYSKLPAQNKLGMGFKGGGTPPIYIKRIRGYIAVLDTEIERELLKIYAIADILISIDPCELERNTLPALGVILKEAKEKIESLLTEG
jgi:hypothetical protein